MRNIHSMLAPFAMLAAMGLTLPETALAASPGELLDGYVAAARKEDAAFKTSTARGESLFRTERTAASGERVACTGCHTADPRQVGKTRAQKPIEPLAPAANTARFTDPAKVEKWFGRNCNDVLSRACTPAEKADFITWLLSIR